MVPVIVLAITWRREAVAMLVVDHHEVRVVRAMAEIVATTPVMVTTAIIIPAAMIAAVIAPIVTAMIATVVSPVIAVAVTIASAIIAIVPVAVVVAAVMFPATVIVVGEGRSHRGRRDQTRQERGSNETHGALLSVS
jgi:hypothetical protein